MSNELEYLCVDKFLTRFLDAQALGAAFALGIIERVERGEAPDVPGANPKTLALLLGLLRENNVLTGDTFTTKFRGALKFRDLLLAKIDFANIAAADLLRGFPTLVRDPAAFMRESDMFRFFSYGNSVVPTPENLRRTAQWMNITTQLTRHEAAVALNRHDFGAHRRMLDIGGNSGEFALQACRRHAHLQATVFDLPVVCEIGRAHLAREPEAARITFLPGDALNDPLPHGHDLITFKSILHDWPDAEAARLISRAADTLAPGGTLLIFERRAAQISAASYANSAHIPFAHCYREPGAYDPMLQESGMIITASEVIALETSWLLLRAKKQTR